MSVPPARLAAWQALSELFLDGALDDDAIASIARQLGATGLDAAKLERIYEEEVAPACWRNLGALPGGVWTGSRKQWLVDAIEDHRRRRGLWRRIGFLKRLCIRRWTARSRADWVRVRQQLVLQPVV